MRHSAFVVSLFAISWIGCGGGPAGDPSIRVVDIFDPESVQGSPSSGALEPSALWDFAASDDNRPEWRAGVGVAGLQAADGKLTGRITESPAAIYASTPEGLDAADTAHAVEIRMRSSAAGDIGATPRGEADPEFDSDLVERIRTRTPEFSGALAESEDFQTVAMTASRVVGLPDGSLIVRLDLPVGSTFEIESIRLVSQREHRASTPTGVGWQGLSDIFHETVSSRSPETFTVDVDVPADSWLDLQVGTVEPGPVTFQIRDISSAEPKTVLRRTVTTPHRWEDASIDLADFTGARTLEFSLDVDEDLRVGFWGSPAIRVRGAAPKTDAPVAEALGDSAPKGVIWFLCDTLRKDHLSVYGHDRETSPNLARMAENGIVFEDNISQATWTKASVPSMMTSLYPTSNRVHGIPDRLSSVANTIAEVYRAAGHATIGFSSNPFTGKLSNLHQGYEELHEGGSARVDEYNGNTARVYVDRAIDWIDRHADTPFFMFVHVFDPHSDYEPRKPYASMWNDMKNKPLHEERRDRALEAAGDEQRSGRLPFQRDMSKAKIDGKEWLDYEKSWYDASIRGMDAELGRLLEKLRMLRIEQDVLIVFNSDHGDEFDEHGRMWHGQSTYGELSRVPLLFYRPGAIPAGRRIEGTVRNLDVMPTLLDLSGLAAPDGIQGQSLAPLIAGSPDWTPLPAVTEKASHPEGEYPKEFESYGLISDGWKIIHNTKGRGDKPEFELYNHRDDPLNQNNLAESQPDRVERLKKELEAWHGMAVQNQLPKGDAPENISAEEEDRLRSLGYIQ